MSEIQARPTIPYAWGEQARCPACSAPDLEVQHQPAGPDQLRCTACGLRFELEMDGPHLRVTRWPDLWTPNSLPPPGSWMGIDELRTLLAHPVVDDFSPRSAPAASAQKPAPRPPAPAVQDVHPATRPPGPAASAPVRPVPAPLPAPPVVVSNDVMARVKKLVDLGSTPMEVRAALGKDGVPPAQVQAAMESAGVMIGHERERQIRKLWGRLAIAAILLPLLLWGGLRLQKAIASRQEAIVGMLRSTVAPNMAQAMGVTTPMVQRLPDPPGAAIGTPVPCPNTPAQAAALFGGDASTWSKGPNGWIRLDNSGGDAIIHVPYGMVAAYFRLGNQMVLVEVPGPALLSQAPSMAISCP